MKKATITSEPSRFARQILLLAIVPLLLYGTLFFVLQPGYIGNFSKGFYLDNGDGFQNVWNVWWVNKSVVEQGANPYFTTMLHAPHGTSLLPQTMNIFNGFMAIPLIHLLGFSLIEAVNFAVVFGFVFGGATMFWFIKKLVGKYEVALVAGALFTFSSYHFAHAQGHLQLVSLEFMPLFLLAFWTLTEKPRYRYAALAAGALFLVSLTDFYYLLWCMMLGALWFAWNVWKKDIRLTRQTIKAMVAFGVLAAALVGPVVVSLLLLNKRDPLTGSHDPAQFGLDVVSMFFPGGSWYWHTLTDAYTTKLEYFAEMSVFMGYGVIAVLIGVFYKSFLAGKKKIKTPSWLNFWWLVLVLFGILSLGPRVSLYGKTADRLPLPYALLEKLLPTLQISGMPVRWILISLIAAIVIVSYALSKLDLSLRSGRAILLVFIAVSCFDLYPRQLPLTSPSFRPYVSYLKELPNGVVIDNGALTGPEQLYNQTLYDKPMAFGYVTRLPESVGNKDFLIFAALEEARYDQLCSLFKVRYVTLPLSRPLKNSTFTPVYQDADTLIYDLKNSDNC